MSAWSLTKSLPRCVWKFEPIMAGRPHLAKILDQQMKISIKQIAGLKLGVFHKFILKCAVLYILVCNYHSIKLLCYLSASPYFMPSNCFLLSTLEFREYPKEQLKEHFFTLRIKRNGQVKIAICQGINCQGVLTPIQMWEPCYCEVCLHHCGKSNYSCG